MNIVYCLNDNYKLYTATSLYSLLDNKNKDTIYNIYILHHPDTEISFFDVIEKKFNIKLNFINMGDIANNLFISRHIQTPTYYRLFITEVISNIDRCIYLDGDTIINKDLTELYNIDMGDKIIGGVLDIYNELFKIKFPHLYINERKPNYINAGVLLINVSKFKEINCFKLYNDYLILNPKPHSHDQDVINFVLENYIYILPHKYNVFNDIMCFNDSDDNLKPLYKILSSINKDYSHETLKKNYNNKIITHYVNKPDLSNCLFLDTWKYYQNTLLNEKYKNIKGWCLNKQHLNILCVTCWFKCGQDLKHSLEERYQNINRFFKYVNNCDIIVYTNDKEMEKYKSNHVKLIYMEISDLYSNKYRDYFEWALNNITSNSALFKRKTSIEHLIIWQSKIDLLTKSLDRKYDGFMWLDIGSFRTELNIKKFPYITDKLLNKLHINFFGELEKINNNDYDTTMAGYIFTCNYMLLIKLHDVFYNILENISKNKIILFDRPAEESILNLCIRYMKDDVILTNETNYYPFIKWYSL